MKLGRGTSGGSAPAPGFDIIHSVSLAAPPARPSRGERTVVTVHDLSWRRYPEGSTPRGRRWHEAALARARDSAAALVVTSEPGRQADLEVDGVAADRITIVHGGSDHLVAADMARTDTVLDQLGVHGDFLLTVGTLEPRKNIGRLISAYGLARAPPCPSRGRWSLSGPRWLGAGAPRPRERGRRGLRRGSGRSRPVWPLRAGAGLRLRPLDRGYGLPCRSKPCASGRPR